MPIPFYLDRARSEENTSANFLRKNRIIDNDAARRNNAQAVASDISNFVIQNVSAIRNARRTPERLPSDWTETIDYNNGYQHEVEDRFRKEHKYLELADYLSHFRMNTPIEQREYDNEISQIRRYGRQYNAIQSQATDKQRYAISFLEAFDYGDIKNVDSKNVYKQEYDEAITRLGKSELLPQNLPNIVTGSPAMPILPTSILNTPDQIAYGEEASTISVTFNNKHVSRALWGFGERIPGFNWITDKLSKDSNENQFDKFVQDTGYDVNDIKSILGDNATTHDENGRLIIKIPKTNLKGIKLLTDIRKWQEDTGRNKDDISYASYSPSDELISDNSLDIGRQINRLSGVLDDCNTDKDIVINSVGSGEQIVSTTFLPYMNERQMRLNQLRQAGAIDASKFNAEMEADNDLYLNALANTAFSQYEVYTDKNNKGDNDDFYPLDDDERGAIKSYIRNAIREKRIKMGVGISGGRYGTTITVLNKDDKGKIIEDSEDARKDATFFIPGLFTESAQNAFNASTQGKTVAEINSMQQYGYQYTLQNGNILSDVGNHSARLYDKDTDNYKNISREEAHSLLHQDIIIQDASNSIRNRMFNLDGSIRQGYDYKSAAQAIAVAGANEVYPNNPIELADVWPISSDDMAARKAAGNLDKDYKVEQAFNVYNEIMNNIFKLINVK